jgi:hypothetical protein
MLVQSSDKPMIESQQKELFENVLGSQVGVPTGAVLLSWRGTTE